MNETFPSVRVAAIQAAPVLFDREGSMVAAGKMPQQHRIPILGLPVLSAKVRFPRSYYTVNEGLYL